MMKIVITLFLLLVVSSSAFGFLQSSSPNPFGGSIRAKKTTTITTTTTTLMKMAGQGFGSSPTGGGRNRKSGSSRQVATYGNAQKPIKDLIDTEAAMKEFFGTNEEWTPLFQSLVKKAKDVAAMPYLGSTSTEEIMLLEEEDSSSNDNNNHGGAVPWKLYPQQPSCEQERAVLGQFLDSMQQSLIDIPVNEVVEEDEDDLHFLEEGRRMLAISRFHVLIENSGGSVENFDALFNLVWSELAYLSKTNEENTGSLILLPSYEYSDLKRFADMNILRPLDWLGIGHVIEVASMELEASPAIRLLHKLTDMPTEPYNTNNVEE